MINDILNWPLYFQIGGVLGLLNILVVLIWACIVLYRMYWRYVLSGNTTAPDPYEEANRYDGDSGRQRCKKLLETTYAKVKDYNPSLDTDVEQLVVWVMVSFGLGVSLSLLIAWPIVLPSIVILQSAKSKRRQQILIDKLSGTEK